MTTAKTNHCLLVFILLTLINNPLSEYVHGFEEATPNVSQLNDNSEVPCAVESVESKSCTISDGKETDGVNNDTLLDSNNEKRGGKEEDETEGKEDGEEEGEEIENTSGSTSSHAPCKDNHEKCEEWAEEGECTTDYKFMILNCPKSCEYCEEDCVDYEEECQEWSEDGYCPYEPEYMYDYCRKSCSSCPTMINHDTDFGVKQNIFDDELKEETIEIIKESIIYMKHVVSDTNFTTVRIICKNLHANCSLWAAQGLCEEEFEDDDDDHVRFKCAPACQSCQNFDMRHKCPIDPDAVDAFKAGDLNRMFERLTSEGSEFAKFGPRVLSRPKIEKEDDEKPEGEQGVSEEEEGKDDDEEEGDYEEEGDQEEEEEDQEEDFLDYPWVVTFENFLTDSEIKKLIHHGEISGYERSEDVGDILPDGTYDSVMSSHRTSYNSWCGDICETDPDVISVLERMRDFTNAPIVNFEPLQLLKYDVGQYYHEHHDYIDFQVERPCGVRVLTFFLYLNDVEGGGGTHFPRLNMTVMPKRGRALLWSSVLDEDPNEMDGRTHHEALVVEKGVKYGANAWIHMRDYVSAAEKDCHS